jgi:hypothetical protein
VPKPPLRAVEDALALALLAACYAGIALGVIAIFWWQSGWLAYGIVACLIGIGAALAHYLSDESLAVVVLWLV